MNESKGYVCQLQDYKGKVKETICDNERELINLVTNLDRKRYSIRSINQFRTDKGKILVKDKLKPYTYYCEKNKDLETGENKC